MFGLFLVGSNLSGSVDIHENSDYVPQKVL